MELCKEWIGLSFVANGGLRAVAGDDDGGVGQWEQLAVDGADEGRAVAAGKVCAADGTGEEGVAGEEEILLGEIEADAALGVAWGVEDAAGEGWCFVADGSDGDELAVVEGVVGRADFRGCHAEPSCLDVHHLDQREVVLVVEDGRAGEGLEAGCTGDVVDVSVGDEDLLDGEIVSLEEGEDAQNLGSGIDDDGLAGGLVAEDGAVALQRANGKDLVDHGDLDLW